MLKDISFQLLATPNLYVKIDIELPIFVWQVHQNGNTQINKRN